MNDNYVLDTTEVTTSTVVPRAVSHIPIRMSTRSGTLPRHLSRMRSRPTLQPYLGSRVIQSRSASTSSNENTTSSNSGNTSKRRPSYPLVLLLASVVSGSIYFAYTYEGPNDIAKVKGSGFLPPRPTPPTASPPSREEMIARLKRSSLNFNDNDNEENSENDDDIFDLLVIGGGATGAGVALDAATRGLRVALVERGDFSSGKSCFSISNFFLFLSIILNRFSTYF